MAFGATLTITINSIAKVLNRINQDSYSSEWTLYEATGFYQLFIRNSKRTVAGKELHRHNMELIYTVYATVPGAADVVRKYFTTSEFPKETDLAQAKLEYAGFNAWLTSAITNGVYEWMS